MTDQDKQAQERFDKVIDQAQTAFWAGVVAEYTESKTGDLSPDTVFHFERAMREALTEWVESNVPPFENKTIEILLHTVEYWYREADETMEMSESDIEHIAYMISQGFGSGELCTVDLDEKEWFGWWEIKK